MASSYRLLNALAAAMINMANEDVRLILENLQMAFDDGMREVDEMASRAASGKASVKAAKEWQRTAVTFPTFLPSSALRNCLWERLEEMDHEFFVDNDLDLNTRFWDALGSNRKIVAIKDLRDYVKIGLREAKDLVDELYPMVYNEQHGLPLPETDDMPF
jgi:hypothetical protein